MKFLKLIIFIVIIMFIIPCQVIFSSQNTKDIVRKSSGSDVPVNVKPKDGPAFHSLIIGINEFSDSKIRNLNYCRSDALAMDSLLRDRNYIPSSNSQVITLIDENASTTAVRSALENLAEHSSNEDTVLIYFSSHGIQQDNLKAYWVLHDTKVDPKTYEEKQLRILPETALGQEEINTLLNRIKAKKLVLFVDCCFSAATVVSTPRSKSFISPPVIDPFAGFKGKGRVFITASQGSQTSVEVASLGHGAFTYFLLEGLKGQADKNNDNVVELWEAWQYLDKKVTNIARQNGNDQQPTISTLNLTHGFPLSTYPVLLAQNQIAPPEITTEGKTSNSQNLDISWIDISKNKTEALKISAMEITNSQYREFVKKNPTWQKGQISPKFHDGDYLMHWPGPSTFPQGLGEHPVTYISWYAAKAFAQWHGGRLPSKKEWEFAAGNKTLYPWGNQWRSDACNYQGYSIQDQSAPGVQTMAVNSFKQGASQHYQGNIYNLSGNVWEWCDDWAYQRLSDLGTKNIVVTPVGRDEKIQLNQLIKGGSFNSDRMGCMIFSQLWSDPRLCAEDGGFRIVKEQWGSYEY